MRLHDPELKLSYLQTSTTRTPQPLLLPGGVWPRPALASAPRTYRGFPSQCHSAQTLPELCCSQDELDFSPHQVHLGPGAGVEGGTFSHQNIVRCVGLRLWTAPRLILLELRSGGDMNSFLRNNRPHLGQPSPLAMWDLLQLAQDITQGCHYLKENPQVGSDPGSEDIAARNCLLGCTGLSPVVGTGDFRMAKYDITGVGLCCQSSRCLKRPFWRAFIFISKTDSWSFGVLFWEIFLLGYMPYPGCTNQDILYFVTGGGQMGPPRGCPGLCEYCTMTRCWRHQPQLCPCFASILEHLQYCIQDPDVLNLFLPMELLPTLDEEKASGLGSRSLEGLRFPTGPGTESGELKELDREPPWDLQPRKLWNPPYDSWAPRGPEGEDSGSAMVPPCTLPQASR
ncbi:leukocyte tyrosine kinase receptor [Lynx pardinus]|uniref:Leukocyte tyrosine kinase receptor n=1 Tax=Lynx pardinus TaxID=191816 RepID=A0A485MSI8_LYNPA|nr:leukocyte tyrosine kinase receptor [Lynx pardinus]